MDTPICFACGHLILPEARYRHPEFPFLHANCDTPAGWARKPVMRRDAVDPALLQTAFGALEP